MASIILQSSGLEKKLMLSNAETQWLHKNYPDLIISQDTICGEICFCREYEGINIIDNFKIKIILKTKEPSMLPKVGCMDDKIQNIAKRLNKKLDELHVNSDDSFCLTVYPKEKSFFTGGIFNIQEFFEKLLEPYLYWISFYAKHNKSPWGEYSHGELGILEFIAEENLDFRSMYKIIKNNKETKLREIVNMCRQNYCQVCKNKSKKTKLRKCHYKAWSGAKIIKQTLFKEFGFIFKRNRL